MSNLVALREAVLGALQALETAECAARRIRRDRPGEFLEVCDLLITLPRARQYLYWKHGGDLDRAAIADMAEAKRITAVLEDVGFPMKGYIFNADGTHDGDVTISNPAELDVFFKFPVLQALANRVEIIITDCDDFAVYHAKDGKVLWDGEKKP